MTERPMHSMRPSGGGSLPDTPGALARVPSLRISGRVKQIEGKEELIPNTKRAAAVVAWQLCWTLAMICLIVSCALLSNHWWIPLHIGYLLVVPLEMIVVWKCVHGGFRTSTPNTWLLFVCIVELINPLLNVIFGAAMAVDIARCNILGVTDSCQYSIMPNIVRIMIVALLTVGSIFAAITFNSIRVALNEWKYGSHSRMVPSHIFDKYFALPVIKYYLLVAGWQVMWFASMMMCIIAASSLITDAWAIGHSPYIITIFFEVLIMRSVATHGVKETWYTDYITFIVGVELFNACYSILFIIMMVVIYVQCTAAAVGDICNYAILPDFVRLVVAALMAAGSILMAIALYGLGTYIAGKKKTEAPASV